MGTNIDWNWVKKQIEKRCFKDSVVAPISTTICGLIIMLILLPLINLRFPEDQLKLNSPDAIFVILTVLFLGCIVWPILNYCMRYSYMIEMCGKISRGEYPKIFTGCRITDYSLTATCVGPDVPPESSSHYVFTDENGIEHAVTNPIFLNERQPIKENPNQKADLYYYNNEQSCLMWR